MLNNLARINLALGLREEADDLYDEALDNNPEVDKIVELGKIMTSMTGKEKELALLKFSAAKIPSRFKDAALKLNGTSNSTIEPEESSFAEMEGVYLNEKREVTTGYDNYSGLSIDFRYNCNAWFLPTLRP